MKNKEIHYLDIFFILIIFITFVFSFLDMKNNLAILNYSIIFTIIGFILIRLINIKFHINKYYKLWKKPSYYRERFNIIYLLISIVLDIIVIYLILNYIIIDSFVIKYLLFIVIFFGTIFIVFPLIIVLITSLKKRYR